MALAALPPLDEDGDLVSGLQKEEKEDGQA